VTTFKAEREHPDAAKAQVTGFFGTYFFSTK
jgi:hypothetical protein